MKSEGYIPIRDISDLCRIEISVLKGFADYGLIDIEVFRDTECVTAGEIEQVKRIIDLYKRLGVNREGIEIILAMRDRIVAMQDEIANLRRRLDLLSNDYRYRFLDLPSRLGLLIDYDERDE